MNYLDDFIVSLSNIGYRLKKYRYPMHGSTLSKITYRWSLPSPKGTVNADNIGWAFQIKEYDVNPPHISFYGPLSYQHGKFHQRGEGTINWHIITKDNYKSYIRSLRKLFKKVNT